MGPDETRAYLRNGKENEIMSRTNLSSQFDAATIANTKAKIVKRNTFQRVEKGETIIRLHGTDIVRLKKDGRAVLNSGGWKTITTKDRINDHMPKGFYLRSEKGQWFVNGVPFFDGMSIPDDVTTPKRKSESAERRDAALRKQIKTFVCDVPLKGPFPIPGAGDCWLCAMKTQEGKTLGDSSGDVDHIREHIKERYLHGSLIVNALTWAGYKNPQMIFQMGLGDNIRRALKRYLYRQCGLVS
jgi:hypothetical protein